MIQRRLPIRIGPARRERGSIAYGVISTPARNRGARIRAALAIAALLILGTGCDRPSTPQSSAPPKPPPAAAQPAESLEAQESRLNATVWRDEVLAGAYQRTFV